MAVGTTDTHRVPPRGGAVRGNTTSIPIDQGGLEGVFNFLGASNYPPAPRLLGTFDPTHPDTGTA